jgi:hypothetical protein
LTALIVPRRRTSQRRSMARWVVRAVASLLSRSEMIVVIASRLSFSVLQAAVASWTSVAPSQLGLFLMAVIWVWAC